MNIAGKIGNLGYLAAPMLLCTFVCQLERYAYWTKLLLSYKRPVLITGAVGVGKTSLIEV